ncbi:Dynamin- protein, partial [Cichlidogyrus casuarinus]
KTSEGTNNKLGNQIKLDVCYVACLLAIVRKTLFLNVFSVNQVICKGWLTILSSNLIGRNGYNWFVLKADSLTWYKDDDEREKKYMLMLDGLRQKASDASFLRKAGICLFYMDPKMNVYKDHKTLDLAADTQEGMESWKAALLRAGVYPIKEEVDSKNDADEPPDAGISSDPLLERQVEIINNLVDSYMKIVTKTQRDMVPKVIMHSLINRLKDFMRTELLPVIYSQDMDRLMEESPEEVERREKLLNMYDALKEGLKIISDVTVNTVSTPLPPPVNEDWIQPDSPKSGISTPSTMRKLSQRGSEGTLNGNTSASQMQKPPSRFAPTRPAPSVAAPTGGQVSAAAAAFQNSQNVPLVPQRISGFSGGGMFQQSSNRSSRKLQPNQSMNLSQSMSDLAHIDWGVGPASNGTTMKQSNANASILFDNWDPFGDNSLDKVNRTTPRPATSTSVYEPNSVFKTFSTGDYLRANSKDRAIDFLA